MRNYHLEGWSNQLQGRNIVGHYKFAGRAGDNGVSAQRYLSLRNPAVQHENRQQYAHVIALRFNAEIFVPGVAATYAWFAFQPTRNYTVTDTTGGSALADADFLKVDDNLGSPVAATPSVLVGRHGAALSGGTIGTLLPGFAYGGVAQAAADTNLSDEPQHAVWSEWKASYGPLLLRGDDGIVFTGLGSGSGGGTINFLYEIEWIESVKN